MQIERLIAEKETEKNAKVNALKEPRTFDQDPRLTREAVSAIELAFQNTLEKLAPLMNEKREQEQRNQMLDEALDESMGASATRL